MNLDLWSGSNFDKGAENQIRVYIVDTEILTFVLLPVMNRQMLVHERRSKQLITVNKIKEVTIFKNG